jgi:PPOX class probable F420-dependent enzyme
MVRLSEDEIWQRLASAHTGIVTTLRRDGMPMALPLWFVADGRTLAFSSPSGSKKVARLNHDPRASFLVESGLAWRELSAIHFTGRIEFVTDPEETTRLEGLINEKYAPFRNVSQMSTNTRSHYADKSWMRFIPDERVLSWDNSRIAQVNS